MSKKKKLLLFFIGLIGLMFLLESISFARGYFNVQRLCADTEIGCTAEGIVAAIYADISDDNELSDMSLAAIEGVLEGGSTRREAFFVEMDNRFERGNNSAPFRENWGGVVPYHPGIWNRGYCSSNYQMSEINVKAVLYRNTLNQIIFEHPIRFFFGLGELYYKKDCFQYDIEDTEEGRLIFFRTISNRYDTVFSSYIHIYRTDEEGRIILPENN